MAITAPRPAANIMSPMIDVPPTVWPSRTTRTVASKPSAHFTNLAEARACSPLRLRMVTSAQGLLLFNTGTLAPRRSSLAGQDLAGDADVFAARLLGGIDGIGQRHVGPDAGKLD